MLPGLTFWFWRSAEILTLIPTLGMLAWFVHGYTVNNLLTPAFILVLFIVSVLACFWAVATLLFYHGMTRWNAHFCAFVDICFVGALIAGVYYLREITGYNCSVFSESQNNGLFAELNIFGWNGQVSGNIYGQNVDKNCAMLKACFAFGIMNVIFFFITFLALMWVGREYPQGVAGRGGTTVRRSSRTVSRGSRSPRRSHQSYRSSRRTYY